MNRRTFRNKTIPYVFIAPTLLFILIFLFYPVLNVFYYSLRDYNMNLVNNQEFIGLKNFADIFQKDQTFYTCLEVSFKWVLTQVLSQLFFGMIIALVLNQSFRFRGIARASVFAPWAISGVLTSMMWSIMFNENMGVINDILLNLHIIDKRVAWIAGYDTSFVALSVAELWRGIPFFAIMLLAGLQSIPKDLYEACDVDGGSRWDKFVHITLSHMKNTIVLATLLRGVWEFNNVDVIYTLTGGGPVHATTTLTMYITQTAIRDANFGYGCALSVIAFFILAIVTAAYLKASGFYKEDD